MSSMLKRILFVSLPVIFIMVIFVFTPVYAAKTFTTDVSSDSGRLSHVTGTQITWGLKDFNDEKTAEYPDYWYKKAFPWVDEILLLTASGGRSENEMYHEDAQGNPYYNFNPIIESISNILRSGKDSNGNYLIKPCIVLAQVPYELAENPAPPANNSFDVNNDDRPKDYDKYYNYIRGLAQALVNKFGASEVEKWRWKCFTEPDNMWGWWNPHGNATLNRDEYFKLYDYTAAALESVINPSKLIFGPGNIMWETTWGKEIIEHAAVGTNYKTGTVGTRLNTLTMSWYARNGNGYANLVDGTENFQTRVDTLRNALEQYPQLKAEFLGSDETQVCEDENGIRYLRGDASEAGGSWLAGLYKRAIDNNFKRMPTWWFQTAQTLYNSGGTNSTQYNVAHMFHKLTVDNPVRLPVIGSGTPVESTDEVEAVTSYDESTNTIRVIIYNHNTARTTNVDEPVTITLNNIAAVNGSNYVLRHYRVDKNHSNLNTIWKSDQLLAGISTKSGFAAEELEYYPKLPLNGWLFYSNRVPYYDKYDDLEKLEDDKTLSISGNSISQLITLPGHAVSLLEFVGVKPLNNIATLSDSINNRAIMYDYSNGLTFRTDNPGIFGDSSRFSRTNTSQTPEYMIYKRSNIQSFVVTTYHSTTLPPTFRFYRSENGTDWTEITSGISTQDTSLGSGWKKRVYSCTGLPSAVGYLKVEWPVGGTDMLTPQLGQVNITYQTSPASLNAPTGLAETHTSSQVTLSWNAVAGANSYNVKRSLTKSGPYTTLASGITSTSHVISNSSGTPYYYVVTAVSGTTESGVSNEIGPVSATIFEDSTFASTPTDWSVDQGTWVVSNEQYKVTVADGQFNRSTIKNINNFQNFSAEIDVKIDSQPYGEDNWVGLIIRKTSINDTHLDSGYLIGLRPNGNIGINRQSVNLVTKNTLARPANGFVRIKVVARGQVIDAYVNGEKISTIQDSNWSSGYISLISYNNTATFDNIKITNLPDILTDLTAIGSQNKIVLNWAQDSSAATYRVERRVKAIGSSFSTIASGITTSTYEDSTCLNGVSYIYRICSIDGSDNVVNTSNTAETKSYAFADFFISGDSNWTKNSGTWSVINEEFNQSSTDNMYMSTINGIVSGDFVAEVSVKINSGQADRWAAIHFRKTNPADSPWTSGYMFIINSNGEVSFNKQGTNISGTVNSGTDPTTKFVRLKVVANGNTLRGYVNWNLIFTITDTSWTSGYFSLITYQSNSSFDDVIIATSVPAAPTLLYASSQSGSKKIDLSWSGSGGANSYIIKRATNSGGPYTQIAVVKGTSYSDIFPLKNQQYYYVVTAATIQGAESVNSAETGPVTASYLNLVTNPGFENDGVPTQTPTGWSTAGANPDADYTQSGGHIGSYMLLHWDDVDYEVYTYQTITGLTNGLYTLTAWVKNDYGNLSTAYMEVKDYGGTTRTYNIPISSTWTQISITDINVTNGQCTIGFYSNSPSTRWYDVDDVEFYIQN